MIIADTSGLLALFNAAEPSHAKVRRTVMSQTDRLVVSPFVIAELDYLVTKRLGMDAALTVLSELAGGAYELAAIDASELEQTAGIIAKYRDQDIGVTDASLVLLANLAGTRRILTLDRRHFDVLRPMSGGRFTLLP